MKLLFDFRALFVHDCQGHLYDQGYFSMAYFSIVLKLCAA